MSFNVVAAVMQYLPPEVVTKVAASLGVDRAMTLKAVSAMVPAILGGLADKASTQDGARALFGILKQQDPGLLGQLGSVVGGPHEGALIDYGSGMLNNALGETTQNALIVTIAKHSGLPEKPTKSLFGLIAPVVSGTLARHQLDNELDADAIAKLLQSQQSSFAQASPAGSSPASIAAPAGTVGKRVEVASGVATAAAAAAAAAIAAPRHPPVQSVSAAMKDIAAKAGVAPVDAGRAPSAPPPSAPATQSSAIARDAAVKTTTRAVEPSRPAVGTATQTGAPQPARAATAPVAARQAPAMMSHEAARTPAGTGAQTATPHASPPGRDLTRRGLPVVAWLLPLVLFGAGSAWWYKDRLDRSNAMEAAAQIRSAADAKIAADTAARAKVEADAAAAKSAADAAAAKLAAVADEQRRAAADAAAKVAQVSEHDAAAKAATVAAAKAAAEEAAAAIRKLEVDAAAKIAEAKAAADVEASRKTAADSAAAQQAAAAAAESKTTADLVACQQTVRDAVTTARVQFEFANATLRSDAATSLARLSEAMKQCPSIRMRIEGHTDNNGDVGRNQRLSENRANAVVLALARAGIDAGRLTALGYGQTKPVASNDSERNRALNRRIEFVIE